MEPTTPLPLPLRSQARGARSKNVSRLENAHAEPRGGLGKLVVVAMVVQATLAATLLYMLGCVQLPSRCAELAVSLDLALSLDPPTSHALSPNTHSYTMRTVVPQPLDVALTEEPLAVVAMTLIESAHPGSLKDQAQRVAVAALAAASPKAIGIVYTHDSGVRSWVEAAGISVASTFDVNHAGTPKIATIMEVQVPK